MKQLYAYYSHVMQVLLFLPLLVALQGCVSDDPSRTPWTMEQPTQRTVQNGQQIDDDLAPIIGWQKQDDNVARASRAQPQPQQRGQVDTQTQDMLKRYAGDADNRTGGGGNDKVYVLSSSGKADRSLAYENDPRTYSAGQARMRDFQQRQRYESRMASEYVDNAVDEVAQKPADRRKVTVALLLPLSGEHKELGKAMSNAAQMAMFDIGVEKFEIIPRDTQGTPAGAIRAAQEAIDNGTDMIIGPVFSESLRAIKPITERARLPVVSFTTDWRLAGGDTYVMGFMPFAQVARVSNYAMEQGYGRFAVLGPQNDYSDIVIRTLHHALDRRGRHIVDTRRYDGMQNQNDLKDIVGDFVGGKANVDNENLHFDALMMPVGGEGLRTVVTMLSYFDVDHTKARFLGTGLWDDPALTREPGLEGAWFAAPDPTLRADFEKRYAETYGRRPPRLATLSYDATALAAVMTQQYNGRGRIYSRPDMTAPRGFAGIDGIFRFRPDGLVERGLAVLEIRRDGIKVIDPAPKAFMHSHGM